MRKAHEPRSGGITALLEIDLYEITVASGPINPDTRFISLKAATAERRVPTDAELIEQAKAVELEIPLSQVTDAELRQQCDEALEDHRQRQAEGRKRDRELRRKSQEMHLEVLIGPDLYADLQARKAAPEPESHAPTDAELRARCKALGFAVPAPRRNHAKSLDAARAEARDHMLALLRGGDR